MTRNLIIFLPFLLSGCVVGPDYVGPPSVVSGERTRASFRRGDPALVAPQPPVARWWEELHDAQLSSLIERALSTNPDIAIAEARVRKARAMLREQRANQLPSFSASGTAIAADLPAGSLALPSQDDRSDRIKAEFYNAGIDASWEIDLFGGRQRAAEGSGAQAEAVEANREDAQVRLSAEVAQTYITLREVQQRLVQARRAATLQSQTLALMRQREQLGASSRDEVVGLQTELTRTEANLLPLDSQIAVGLDQLALLTGDEPGAHDVALSFSQPIPALPREIAIGDPASMLRRRPDIRAAERQLAASNAQIGANVARQFPSVSFMGIIGLGGPNIGDIIDTGNVSTLLLPRISWSFLDFGRNRAKVEQARADRDEAAARYRQSVLSALSDAETSLTKFGSLRQALLAHVRSRVGALQSANFAKQRYKEGATPLAASLDAERAALVEEQQVLEAEGELARSFVTLQKSLGLGWQAVR